MQFLSLVLIHMHRLKSEVCMCAPLQFYDRCSFDVHVKF